VASPAAQRYQSDTERDARTASDGSDGMTEAPETLARTASLDYDHPAVAEFTRRHAGTGTAREKAVRLYYAVRDGIRYDPYAFHVAPEWLTASRTLQAGYGWCVPKALLLAACCRAAGIPARLGYADVKNHLATERLLRMMDNELFVWHGYVALRLEGRWVKATPAFNIEMCRRFGVLPLEFDGTADSLLHPYDVRGQRHMEYVRDRGLFDDLPYDALVADMRAAYPRLIAAAEAKIPPGSFETDAVHAAR
jgi:transglutaminase-like putative cysteine protease